MKKYNFQTVINVLDGVIPRNTCNIMRDDLIPFYFGGNKVRKAILFFEEVDAKKYDYIVTYGSSTSNHCRVIANLAAKKTIPCLIISPKEVSPESYNRQLVEMFGVKTVTCEISDVKSTIDNTIQKLRNDGYKPYFIPGGGHGILGTKAYFLVYEEIKRYEARHHTFFDYIFLASGTGTTQAGLICGKLVNKDENRKIVGISIARRNPRATEVIKKSILEYLKEVDSDLIEESLLCVDEYICGGYGVYDKKISDLIVDFYCKYGIPLDPIYTGKALWGMIDYCIVNQINSKNILFIHTGGTPLFFDFLQGRYERD